ncbi:MAG: 23S rRNA (guanosine(2251)-2'-O)-methyltransferase RlmB [Saprospirales bacterium]|nr:MAG: 23S rRNA (guanosine(2251)-2'-O)-methyltransferase RlmB [Saprospirales bacterium]
MKKDYELVAGRKALIDALDSGRFFEKIIIDRELTGEIEIKLRKWCDANDVPLQRLPLDVIGKYTLSNHQGVVGIISPIEYASLDETVDNLVFEKGNPVFIVLDQVKDVRNFGAIARSAEALGADAIIIPSGGSAMINDFAIKTSAGALLNIPVCRVSSLFTALKNIKLHGVEVLVADAENGIPLSKADLNQPIAIVLGSEDTGVRTHIRRIADKVISIPQSGKTESLNVSVSAGIILYEVSRQRQHSVKS